MTDFVPVLVPCPTEQHPDGDSVFLRPKLGLAAGVEIQSAIGDIGRGASLNQTQGILAELFVRHGVAEWTLHDDEDNTIVLTPETLQARLLDDFTFAEPIAEKANELYAPAVVTPLVMRAAKSLRASRPGGSTSASKGSPRSRRKPSKRSSTSTSQTAATTATSA